MQWLVRSIGVSPSPIKCSCCSHCSALVCFRNRFERDLYTQSFLFHNYISSCWYPNTRFIFHGIACITALVICEIYPMLLESNESILVVAMLLLGLYTRLGTSEGIHRSKITLIYSRLNQHWEEKWTNITLEPAHLRWYTR